MFEQQSDPANGVVNPAVYKGLWKAFHKPPVQQWTLTVTTLESIIILSLLTISVTLIQGRAWVIGRYIVWTRTKPVSLPTTDRDRGIVPQEISQVTAAKDIIGLAIRETRKKWRSFTMRSGPRELEPRELQTDDEPCDSNAYGIVAIVLYAVFTIIGVVLPFLISDGTMGPPIVRSKETAECLGSDKIRHLGNIMLRPLMTDGVYEACVNKQGMDCDKKYLLTEPDIEAERVDCPFADELCQPDIRGLRITRKNITFLEAGVNSRYHLTTSHRVTCSPIELDDLTYPFTNQTKHKGSIITVSNVDFDDPAGSVWINMSMFINTKNGPGHFSDEKSGLIVYREGHARRLTILPRYLSSDQAKSQPEILHPGIRREEWATPWIAVFQAGDSDYAFEISDPFFNAHNCHKDRGEYNTTTCIADHEATAIGCIEQFSICSNDLDYCTPWLTSRLAPQLIRYLLDEKGFEAPSREVQILMSSMMGWLSVYEYIGMVTWLDRRVPVTDYTGAMGILRHSPFKGKELWAEEVKTWCRKALLAGLLHAQLGARFFIWNTDDDDPKWKKDYGLCGRVLFRDPDHVNIDWVGFWIWIGSLVVVWLVSLCVNYRRALHDVWNSVFPKVNRFCWAIRRRIVRMVQGTVMKLLGRLPYETIQRVVVNQEPRATTRPLKVVHGNNIPELCDLEDMPIELGTNEELDISNVRLNH
ncbi:hypothetical protein FALCPG4_014943 [Fusarium falciforme]